MRAVDEREIREMYKDDPKEMKRLLKENENEYRPAIPELDTVPNIFYEYKTVF